MRIGQIPYLNSVLFYYGLKDAVGADLSFEPLVPRQLSGAAVEDGVDAGPVPLVTCWDIEDRYEPLGDFCISTKNETRSIFLFSKYPFEELDGASVGVTGETSTSARLLKVLMANVYRATPSRYVALDWGTNDAFLLIGDEALLHRNGVRGYPFKADLGAVWHEWTRLPFVFARWVVRKDLDAESKQLLIAGLSSSMDAGWNHFDKATEEKRKALSMSDDEVREYMEGFRFRMTDAESEAIGRFRQLDAAIREGEAEATAGSSS